MNLLPQEPTYAYAAKESKVRYLPEVGDDTATPPGGNCIGKLILDRNTYCGVNIYRWSRGIDRFTIFCWGVNKNAQSDWWVDNSYSLVSSKSLTWFIDDCRGSIYYTPKLCGNYA